MTISEHDLDGEFAAGVERHQQRERDEAQEAQERSVRVAARPDADAQVVTFADLRVGDYMTNEGPSGRWVKVVALRGPACRVKTRQRTSAGDGQLSVLFEIPEAVTVSGETHYWIERAADHEVLIDAAARR